MKLLCLFINNIQNLINLYKVLKLKNIVYNLLYKLCHSELIKL